MTLEEAIKHCEEKACSNTECASEHQQLAEWLKELQRLKSLPSNLDDAADEIVKDWLAYGNGEYKKLAIAGAEWMAGQDKSKLADDYLRTIATEIVEHSGLAIRQCRNKRKEIKL